MSYHRALAVTLRPLPSRLALALFLAILAAGAEASAAPPPPAADPPSAAAAPSPAGQGLAVVGVGAARDEAYALARAVYGSSLRPRTLDEIRARVLAGDPPPALSSRETRELAELRAAVKGDDAPSRRLLADIARELGVEGLLVVSVAPAPAPAPEVAPAPAAGADAGEEEEDAGAPADAAAPRLVTTARLFLAESGELDAARYEPEGGLEGAAAWRGVVSSLERRFAATRRPAAAPASKEAHVAPPTMRGSETPNGKPFYASAWFWGAVGAAVLVGGAFWLASRDTSDDPIHLQMRVPR